VRAVPQILSHEKGVSIPGLHGIDEKGTIPGGSDSSVDAISVKDDRNDRLRWNKVTVAFFLIGLLVSTGSHNTSS
jgi:hypothetical protein